MLSGRKEVRGRMFMQVCFYWDCVILMLFYLIMLILYFIARDIMFFLSVCECMCACVRFRCFRSGRRKHTNNHCDKNPMFIQNIFGTIQSSRVIFFCYIFFRVLRAGQVGYNVRRRNGPGTLTILGHFGQIEGGDIRPTKINTNGTLTGKHSLS